MLKSGLPSGNPRRFDGELNKIRLVANCATQANDGSNILVETENLFEF